MLIPKRPAPPIYVPADMAEDKFGNVYLADDGDHRIKKFSPKGRLLAVWGTDNPPEFNTAYALTVDAHGTVYAASDSGIVKLSPRGQILARWSRASQSDRPCSTYRGCPASLTAGGRGNLFALYLDNKYSGPPAGNYAARIVKYSPQGRVLATWHLDEPGLEGTYPKTIAVTARGDVYLSVYAVSDCAGRAGCKSAFFYIHELSPAGRLVRTWGGRSGTGIWASFEPLSQYGNTLAGVDSLENLYLFNDRRVEKLSPTGAVRASWTVSRRMPDCGPGVFVEGRLASVDMRGMLYVIGAVWTPQPSVGTRTWVNGVVVESYSPHGDLHTIVSSCPRPNRIFMPFARTWGTSETAPKAPKNSM